MQAEKTLLLCESCFNLILEEEAQFLEHQPCCANCSDTHKGVSP
jgi:hypothetical protein